MADVYFLLEYPIYRDLEAADIDILSSICVAQKYAPGMQVFKEGDWADGLFIIKKGNVNIIKESNGIKTQVAMLSEGEFFGEMALIDGAPRSATVEAGAEGAELIRLTNEGFNKLKSDYSKTGFKVMAAIMKFMSYRIRRTTATAAAASVATAPKPKKKKKITIKHKRRKRKKKV